MAPATRNRMLFAGSMLLVFALAAHDARADGAEDAATAEAREAFVAGARLVEEARWPEALEKFQLAQQKRPHPITRYNIAACFRALGVYTAARRSYAEALAESQAEHGGKNALGERTDSEVKGLLVQLDGIIASLELTLSPSPVMVSVDGAPLTFESADMAVAGLRAPGPAEAVTAGHLTLRLNPGVHTLSVRGDGFADAAVTYTLLPGAKRVVELRLDRLPSTLYVAAVPASSVVRVDDVDVGTAPATVTRAPGVHRVHIVHPGFLPYDAQVTTHPGEDLRITGNLTRESRSLTSRWWFWGTIGAVVVSVAVASYVIVRSTETPARTPYDGGTLGWTVSAR